WARAACRATSRRTSNRRWPTRSCRRRARAERCRLRTTASATSCRSAPWKRPRKAKRPRRRPAELDRSMSPTPSSSPPPDPSVDPLLRKASDAVARERERMRADAARAASRSGQGAAAGFIQRLVDRGAAILRLLWRPVRWVGSLFRGRMARYIRNIFAWAAFERENGAFRLDRDGRRIFSRNRLIACSVAFAAILVILHVALSAAHFYTTRFDELV